MIPEFKNRLKLEIDVYLTKYPAATSKDIKNFLFLGEPAQELFTINLHALNKFILFQKRKFAESGATGSLLNNRVGAGRKKVESRN